MGLFLDSPGSSLHFTLLHFTISFVVQVSDGLFSYHPEEQLLVYKHGSLDVSVHRIVITRRTSL